MAAHEWFDQWFDTPYYHQLYFQRDAAEAAAFIARLVQWLQPAPGSQMLDVACGQGRHSHQLHSLGFEVTGIDLSSASIAQANEGAEAGLQFFVHDMRQPFWINYFDVAFNFFTSFGYFRTRREHDAAIRTMAQALKPGGRLVIDYLNVHYAEEHLQPRTELDVDDMHFHITRWMDETHFYKKIEVENDSFTEPHVYIEKVAKFSPGDFTDMLAYQGMQVTHLFGDYAMQPYHIRQSPRMIVVAQKMQR